MKHVYRVLLGVLAFAAIAFGTTPKESSRDALVAPKATTTAHASNQHALTFYTGSLRDNLTRLAASYGWSDVVWLPRNDFQWHGTLTLTDSSLDNVLSKVLKNYPLQAQFYDGNHILVIAQRTL